MTYPLLKNPLPEKIKSVWRLSDTIGFAIFLAIIGVIAGGLSYFAELADPIRWVLIGMAVLNLIILIVNLAINSLRYRYTRYEIRENEVCFQSGVFFRKTTYAPIYRIQHVEIDQGPLLRQAGLVSIVIHTAATSHTIAGLEGDTANALRDQILALVKEYRDDL